MLAARNLSARVSYLIISTIVVIVAVMAVLNGIGLRRQGKRDEGTAWILASALAIVVVVGGWGAFRSFHSVNAGHVLVVRQFGEIVGQRGDGFQTIAPWQTAEEVSTQVESQRFQMDERTGAAEGTISSGPAISEETQPVYAVVTLNYRVSDKAVQELFTDVGSTYFDKVVAPRVFQVFKNETVKFKSVSVAPNREQIRAGRPDRARPAARRLLDRRRRLPDQRPRLPAGVHRGDRAQAGRDAGRARGAAEGRAVEGRGAAGDRARPRPGAGAAAAGELADRPQPPVRGAADPQGGAAADRLPAGRPGQPARSVDLPEVGYDHALIRSAACGSFRASSRVGIRFRGARMRRDEFAARVSAAHARPQPRPRARPRHRSRGARRVRAGSAAARRRRPTRPPSTRCA